MSEVFIGKGSCLCGAVSFIAKNANKKVGVCHCGMCRKWGGAPAMLVNCGSEVSFVGEDNIAVYASSKDSERGFCKSCGSSLFYRMKKNKHHFIASGLFNKQGLFSLEQQIFIDKKPAFYSFKNNTVEITEAQFFGDD